MCTYAIMRCFICIWVFVEIPPFICMFFFCFFFFPSSKFDVQIKKMRRFSYFLSLDTSKFSLFSWQCHRITTYPNTFSSCIVKYNFRKYLSSKRFVSQLLHVNYVISLGIWCVFTMYNLQYTSVHCIRI